MVISREGSEVVNGFLKQFALHFSSKVIDRLGKGK